MYFGAVRAMCAVRCFVTPSMYGSSSDGRPPLVTISGNNPGTAKVTDRSSE